MRKRSIASVVFALALAVALGVIATGCGGETSSRNWIDAQQFTTLQKVRNEVSTMIQEVAEASNPSSPLAERLARINAALRRHKASLPETSLTPVGGHSNAKLRQQVAGTLVAQLLTFEMGSDASVAADQYLGAVGTLYGLRDFEIYLLKHTVDNGSAINPADPPPNMEPSQSQGFSRNVSVKITYDKSTGKIKWILGENPPDYRLSDSTVPQIEARFIKNAQWFWTMGNNFVLDFTRL